MQRENNSLFLKIVDHANDAVLEQLDMKVDEQADSLSLNFKCESSWALKIGVISETALSSTGT
jgi:hypothetical protein